MAWRRSGDKPLFEPMMVSLLTHISVTRPRWTSYRYQRVPGASLIHRLAEQVFKLYRYHTVLSMPAGWSILKMIEDKSKEYSWMVTVNDVAYDVGRYVSTSNTEYMFFTKPLPPIFIFCSSATNSFGCFSITPTNQLARAVTEIDFLLYPISPI